MVDISDLLKMYDSEDEQAAPEPVATKTRRSELEPSYEPDYLVSPGIPRIKALIRDVMKETSPQTSRKASPTSDLLPNLGRVEGKDEETQPEVTNTQERLETASSHNDGEKYNDEDCMGEAQTKRWTEIAYITISKLREAVDGINELTTLFDTVKQSQQSASTVKRLPRSVSTVKRLTRSVSTVKQSPRSISEASEVSSRSAVARPTCYRCNERGHYPADCSLKPVCGICKRRGHYSHECRKRVKVSVQCVPRCTYCHRFGHEIINCYARRDDFRRMYQQHQQHN